MIRSIRRAALVLAVAAPALAAQQPAKPAEKPAEKPAMAMDHAAHDQHAAKPKLDGELAEHFKGIALSDAQVKQVTEIKAKHHKAMDALKKDAKDPNDAALKSELQKHMDAEHAEFLSLLSPEQRQTFAENMKGHHKAEGEKHDMKHDMKPDMKHEMPKKP